MNWWFVPIVVLWLLGIGYILRMFRPSGYSRSGGILPEHAAVLESSRCDRPLR